MTEDLLEKRLARIEAMLEQLLSRQAEPAQIMPSISQEIAIGRMNGKTAMQVIEERYKSSKKTRRARS